MNQRCNHCANGRRDGELCNIASCLCRCHRQGIEAVEKIDAAIAEVEVRRKRLRPNGTPYAFEIPLSFDEEFGAAEKKIPTLVK